MSNKFAIVVLGNQNSGKTTTIKYFDEMYDEWSRKKKQCRAGWRSLILFRDTLCSIYSAIYFVPASPSETQYPLVDRMKKVGYAPDLLLVAEQKKGAELQNTMNYLQANGYDVVTFDLDRKGNDLVWGDWNTSSKKDVLEKRGEAICTAFKNFIIKVIR